MTQEKVTRQERDAHRTDAHIHADKPKEGVCCPCDLHPVKAGGEIRISG